MVNLSPNRRSPVLDQQRPNAGGMQKERYDDVAQIAASLLLQSSQRTIHGSILPSMEEKDDSSRLSPQPPPHCHRKTREPSWILVLSQQTLNISSFSNNDKQHGSIKTQGSGENAKRLFPEKMKGENVNSQRQKIPRNKRTSYALPFLMREYMEKIIKRQPQSHWEMSCPPPRERCGRNPLSSKDIPFHHPHLHAFKTIGSLDRSTGNKDGGISQTIKHKRQSMDLFCKHPHGRRVFH